MKCSICYGTMQNGRINIMGKDVCILCIKCIGSLETDDIFYDFYKNRIKKLLSPLSQQP